MNQTNTSNVVNLSDYAGIPSLTGNFPCLKCNAAHVTREFAQLCPSSDVLGEMTKLINVGSFVEIIANGIPVFGTLTDKGIMIKDPCHSKTFLVLDKNLVITSATSVSTMSDDQYHSLQVNPISHLRIVGENEGVRTKNVVEFSSPSIKVTPLSMIIPRVVRLLTWFYQTWLELIGKKISVACISNYRDMTDVSKFGYDHFSKLPLFLPWIMFRWSGIHGRLYMIGSVTEQIAGDAASTTSVQIARSQFILAVKEAIVHGADTILFAATTKRLFKKGELEQIFPGVVFTLGDNFTGLLLGEQILEAFNRSYLEPKKSRVLLIAPYGLLGGVALHYLTQSGCELICMGNKKRESLLHKLALKFGFKEVYDFDSVGVVDMVVACNSSTASKLTPDVVKKLQRNGKKLIVIDPNEPQNMTPELFASSEGSVLRYDAGNGYSPDLKFFLGGFSAGLLRLSSHVVWGCFCEALLISKYSANFGETDWYEISPDNIQKVRTYFGNRAGSIGLPAPTNFSIPIKDFVL